MGGRGGYLGEEKPISLLLIDKKKTEKDFQNNQPYVKQMVLGLVGKKSLFSRNLLLEDSCSSSFLVFVIAVITPCNGRKKLLVQ